MKHIHCFKVVESETIDGDHQNTEAACHCGAVRFRFVSRNGTVSRVESMYYFEDGGTVETEFIFHWGVPRR